MRSRVLGTVLLLAFASANVGNSVCAVVHHSAAADHHASHHGRQAAGPVVGETTPPRDCAGPMHCGVSVIAVRTDAVRPTTIVLAEFSPIPIPTAFAPTPPASISTPPPRV